MGWLLQKRLNSISRKSDGGAARMAQLDDLVCIQVCGSRGRHGGEALADSEENDVRRCAGNRQSPSGLR